jgi:hypothetical protein
MILWHLDWTNFLFTFKEWWKSTYNEKPKKPILEKLIIEKPWNWVFITKSQIEVQIKLTAYWAIKLYFCLRNSINVQWNKNAIGIINWKSSSVSMNTRVEWFYMVKFQNVNFEKPVVLKVAHDHNNKKIVQQLFKILRSSTRASALKIKNL